MHIPTCGTAEQEILPFQAALAQALLPCPYYDAAHWLYVPNRYCDYRYILGTAGTKPLICIGVNPSTAAPGDLDPTLKSVERIALGNGYDSFLMFNLYPSGPHARTIWSKTAIPSSGRRTPPPSAGPWSRPGTGLRRSGRPGAPSLKSAPIWPTAFGI